MLSYVYYMEYTKIHYSINKPVMLISGPSPIALTGFMYTLYSLLGYSPLIVTLVAVVLIVILCTLTM